MPFLGIEGSYTNFGEYGGGLASAEVDGYGIAAILRLPISNNFGIYAKGGQFFWDADTEILGINQDFDGDEPFYGVGLDFRVNELISLSLEYSRYEIRLGGVNLPADFHDSDTDLDTIKAGIKLHF